MKSIQKKHFFAFLQQLGISGQGRKMPAAVVRIHHQGKSREGKEPETRIRKDWHAMQDILLQWLLEIFQVDLSSLNHCNNFDCAGAILSGLVVYSDWLASGQPPFMDLPQVPPQEYLSLASQAAREVIKNCLLHRCSPFCPAEIASVISGLTCHRMGFVLFNIFAKNTKKCCLEVGW